MSPAAAAASRAAAVPAGIAALACSGDVRRATACGSATQAAVDAAVPEEVVPEEVVPEEGMPALPDGAEGAAQAARRDTSATAVAAWAMGLR